MQQPMQPMPPMQQQQPQQRGAGARIAFMILFIIGAGAVFVCTAGPLSGPGMSWAEASVGLVPGAFMFLLFHFLHVYKLGQANKRGQAAIWWTLATLFLIGLGAIMTFGGMHEQADAESALRRARAQNTRASYADPFNPYGAGYGGGYRDTYLEERDVEHYETAVAAGVGMLGLSILFMIGTGIAFVGFARRNSTVVAAPAHAVAGGPHVVQPHMMPQQPVQPQPQQPMMPQQPMPPQQQWPPHGG